MPVRALRQHKHRPVIIHPPSQNPINARKGITTLVRSAHTVPSPARSQNPINARKGITTLSQALSPGTCVISQNPINARKGITTYSHVRDAFVPTDDKVRILLMPVRALRQISIAASLQIPILSESY